MSQPVLPLIANPETLKSALGQDDLLIVDLGSRDNFIRHHIPGAVQVEYSNLLGPQPPAMGLIADRA